jgi:hypothetical protein
MSSGKKRRRSVSASSGIIATDRAEGFNQRGANPENWRLFIDLKNRTQGFDISAPIDEDRKWRAVEDAKRKGEAPPQYDPPPRQCVWDGCKLDRPAEKLYRLSRARRRGDRWVLDYPGRDDLLGRELTTQEAAYWIRRINRYALPPDLGSITTATTDDAYPRLDPARRPGPEPPTRSDGRELPAPDSTDDPSDPAEKLREDRRAAGAASSGIPGEAPDVPDMATLLKRTCDLLKGTSLAMTLVRFLGKELGKKFTREAIARHLYSKNRVPRIGQVRNAEQLIRRTAKTLAMSKAPLRIEFDFHLDEISLVNPDAKSGPATSSGEDVTDVER